MPEKAVFLDKDGTLIQDVPYNVDPKRIVLVPGAGKALKRLADNEFRLVIISNQSGIARGYFKEEELQVVFSRINEMLLNDQVQIDAFYYCPHHPEGKVAAYSIPCSCRKPEDGLIRKAKDELNIDVGRSWMVGDILNDVEAGKRAGCQTVLIDNGNETEWLMNTELRRPDFTASDLEEMADIIVANSTEQV